MKDKGKGKGKAFADPIPHPRVSNRASIAIVPPSDGEDSASSFQGPEGMNVQELVQPMRQAKLLSIPIVGHDIEHQLLFAVRVAAPVEAAALVEAAATVEAAAAVAQQQPR